MVSIISFSDLRGGAARAANSVYLALKKSDVKVQLLVAELTFNNEGVKGPSRLQFIKHFLLRLVSYAILKVSFYKGYSKLSLNIFNSSFVINQARYQDNLHIHWFNNETLSINKLASFCDTKRVIITLHDEWLYSGIEHCKNDIFNESNIFKPEDESFIFRYINDFIFKKKIGHRLAFQKAIYTVPSRWMYNRAKNSDLLNGCDIRLIPNIIDTEIFHKKNIQIDNVVRDWNLKKCMIFSFGAVNLKNNPLKGGKILEDTINALGSVLSESDKGKIKLITFGDGVKGIHYKNGIEVYNVGMVKSQEEMACLYSNSTVTVIPSLTESFGQIAAESLSCETPVLCFDCTGLVDIVKHNKTGYLATSYSSDSLLDGFLWFLNKNESELREMGARGRAHVKDNYSESVVSRLYLNIYSEHYL